MNWTQALEKYAKEIQKIGIEGSNELSFRTPLHNLLDEVAKTGAMPQVVLPQGATGGGFNNKQNNYIEFKQEAKTNNYTEINSTKRPDFLVLKPVVLNSWGQKQAEAENQHLSTHKELIGSIETKKIEANLKETIKTSQIKEYSLLQNNIIITNYKEFYLVQVMGGRANIIKKVKLLEDDLNLIKNTEEGFQDLITSFLSYNFYPHGLTREQTTTFLAKLTKEMKHTIQKIINDDNKETKEFNTKMQGLHKEYNKVVSVETDFDNFLDSYCQSFIYGVLLSKLNHEDLQGKKLTLNENDAFYVKDMYEQFSQKYKMLYEFLKQGIDPNQVPPSLYPTFVSIAKTFNLIDLKKLIQKEKQGYNNLIVHLYEDYLKEYDQLERKQKGVYYTPKPVVDFIVRNTDSLLKEKLGLNRGFTEDNVKVLDFATGTGSFLLSLFKHAMQNLPKTELARNTLKRTILANYYGFELLFAPYLVAHTNLGHEMAKNKMPLTSDERLKVYLTNTLDLGQDSISDLLPELQNEYKQSQQVKKEENIIAIIGNPPYNNKSQNKEDAMLDLLKEYYKKDLTGEGTINSLNDDYVKFMCFAHQKIDKAGQGVLGFITNNSYMNGVTFRQMRKKLMQSFDEIYILNLHGNSNIKEPCKNVFDIRVGTAIAFFVKTGKKQEDNKAKNENLAKVYYYSTLENAILKREAKFNFLNKNNLSTIKWQTLEAKAPNYFFVPKDTKGEEEYNTFWSLVSKEKNQNAIFNNFNTGMESGIDEFTIHYTKKTLEKLKEDIKNLEPEQIRTKYSLKTDDENWTVKNAKEDLINNYNPQKIMYRPFDVRYTSLAKKSKSFFRRPSYDTMKHFDNKENIGLVFKRQIEGEKFDSVFISTLAIERQVGAGPGPVYLAPLYTYGKHSGEGGLWQGEEEVKEQNFTPKFKEFLKTLNFAPTPEEVLAYIYAIMHSEGYRTKYLEFLKIAFPKVPITKNKEIFYKYSSLGQELIDLHTMQQKPQTNIDYEARKNKQKVTVQSLVDEEFVLKKITHHPQKNILELTSTQGDTIEINKVTTTVWNYKIGSYQPIDKYLKYRKTNKTPLTMEAIHHTIQIAEIIKQSIKLTKQITELGEGWNE